METVIYKTSCESHCFIRSFHYSVKIYCYLAYRVRAFRGHDIQNAVLVRSIFQSFRNLRALFFHVVLFLHVFMSVKIIPIMALTSDTKFDVFINQLFFSCYQLVCITHGYLYSNINIYLYSYLSINVCHIDVTIITVGFVLS